MNTIILDFDHSEQSITFELATKIAHNKQAEFFDLRLLDIPYTEEIPFDIVGLNNYLENYKKVIFVIGDHLTQLNAYTINFLNLMFINNPAVFIDKDISVLFVTKNNEFVNPNNYDLITSIFKQMKCNVIISEITKYASLEDFE